MGKKRVTEYYHRGVVAHLVGFDLPIVLDIEMVGPGEGEITAARRLLTRLMPRYSRFFDAIQGDALYWEAPLFHLCQKHGKYLLAVLKDNNPAVLADAKSLLTNKEDLITSEEERVIRYWDQEGFTSDSIQTPFRILRTEETLTKRERIAGKWVCNESVSNWFWATGVPRYIVPSRQLAQVGHRRWRIENSIFNALSNHWGLDHCFHHHPVAIVNFILILFIAHTLVACFHRRNLKDPLWRNGTLIAVALELRVTMALVSAKDIPWLSLLNKPP